MATGAEDGVAEIWADWQDAVNMTANQLEDFLDTEESKSVGDRNPEPSRPATNPADAS
jgi:Protein of unknown function (DUF3140)